MIPIRIEILGRLDDTDRRAADQALHDEFQKADAIPVEIETEFLTEFPDGFDETSPRSCAARVCVISDDDDRDRRSGRRFMIRSLNVSPHVPVIFAGSKLPSLSQYRIAGILYPVGSPIDWNRIARTVRAAVETNWWSVISSLPLPVMMVNRSGLVVEANSASRNQYGEDLVGQSYPIRVEGRSTSELSRGHPIHDALGLGDDLAAEPSRRLGALSRYAEIGSPADGAVTRRTQLLCFPVGNLLRQKQIPVAVVLCIDLRHLDRINDAAREFASAEDARALQERIVEQTVKLGYRRVRLYEYDLKDKALFGRAQIGLRDPENARSFLSKRLSLHGKEGDVESRDTIHRNAPALFIYDDQPRDQPESDLVRYCRRGADGEELEKTDVGRWVDAPLLIPQVDANGRVTVRSWGKLSVDDAENSNRLTPRDVAEVTALAVVAGGAMAEKLRTERDRKLLEISEDYFGRLDKAEWRRPEQSIRDDSRNLLLLFFRDLFDLDLAFVRVFHPKDRILRLTGEPIQRIGAVPADLEVPRVIHYTEYKNYAMFGPEGVDEEGGLVDVELFRPFLHDRDDPALKEARERFRGKNPKIYRYLDWIGTELGIPILVQNKVRGVLIGLSSRSLDLSPSYDIVLRRFRAIAQIWYQLGELHDARASSISTLGDCLKVWPLLQDARNEAALHAGLAAILTAGCGLGWHRALIFRNPPHGSHTVELTYGLGGLGEPTHGDSHRFIEESEPDLETLVRKRLTDPVPHGVDPVTGEDHIDSLYRTYLLNHSERVSIHLDEFGSPLPGLLASAPKERARFVKLDQDSEWIQGINARYPGLLPARATYLFPFFPNATPEKSPEPTGKFGPLGFVFLDNAYRPNPLEDTVAALTSAIVELARDVIVARLGYRLISGMLGALPFIRHGPKVRSFWSGFETEFGKLLERLRADPIGDVAKSVRSVVEAVEELEIPINEMANAQTHIAEWRKLDHIPEVIPDLKIYLDKMIEHWESKEKACFIEKAVNLPDGYTLHCDPVILGNSLRGLLENSRSFSIPDREGRFRVRLSAECRAGFHPFREVVTIKIGDEGPGIPAERIPLLFIEGYSDRRDQPPGVLSADATHRHGGIGLGMARAFLLRSGGDLRLEDPGGDGRGATFAVRFGVGSNSSS